MIYKIELIPNSFNVFELDKIYMKLNVKFKNVKKLNNLIIIEQDNIYGTIYSSGKVIFFTHNRPARYKGVLNYLYSEFVLMDKKYGATTNIEVIRDELEVFLRYENSTVKVSLVEGGLGKIKINNKDIDTYFNQKVFADIVRGPLINTNTDTVFDVYAFINGGRTKHQAASICAGITKALLNKDMGYKKLLPEYEILKDTNIYNNRRASYLSPNIKNAENVE